MGKKRFHISSFITRILSYISIAFTVGIVLFLFLYVFSKGASAISWEFLTDSPRGAILGQEGGIFPAIVGSMCFTLVAIILGGIPAIGTALYLVFICKSRKISYIVRLVISCISGVPSIVLGLFAYSFLVRDLNLGRCILASGVAQAIMILPFIEVRVEKACRELDMRMVNSSYALGCGRAYTFRKVIMPAIRAEVFSGLILGGCFAMGATAPLIFTGAVAFAGIPHSILEPAMALPLHLYLMVAQGSTSLNIAYGTAFVMMAIILISNLLVTIYVRRRTLAWR